MNFVGATYHAVAEPSPRLYAAPSHDIDRQVDHQGQQRDEHFHPPDVLVRASEHGQHREWQHAEFAYPPQTSVPAKQPDQYRDWQHDANAHPPQPPMRANQSSPRNDYAYPPQLTTYSSVPSWLPDRCALPVSLPPPPPPPRAHEAGSLPPPPPPPPPRPHVPATFLQSNAPYPPPPVSDVQLPSAAPRLPLPFRSMNPPVESKGAGLESDDDMTLSDDEGGETTPVEAPLSSKTHKRSEVTRGLMESTAAKEALKEAPHKRRTEDEALNIMRRLKMVRGMTTSIASGSLAASAKGPEKLSAEEDLRISEARKEDILKTARWIAENADMEAVVKKKCQGQAKFGFLFDRDSVEGAFFTQAVSKLKAEAKVASLQRQKVSAEELNEALRATDEGVSSAAEKGEACNAGSSVQPPHQLDHDKGVDSGSGGPTDGGAQLDNALSSALADDGMFLAPAQGAVSSTDLQAPDKTAALDCDVWSNRYIKPVAPKNAGWVVKWSERKAHWYWFHAESKKSRWRPPREEEAAAVPPLSSSSPQTDAVAQQGLPGATSVKPAQHGGGSAAGFPTEPGSAAASMAQRLARARALIASGSLRSTPFR